MQEYIDFVGKNPLLFIALIAVLAFIVKVELSRFTRKFKQVNVNEAVLLMNKDETVVLDVREDKEIKGGIIKGARHITLGQLNDRIGQLGNNKQVPVLVYCRTGTRSGAACQTITKAGFENVSSLTGGIMAWGDANLPIERR